MKQKYIQPQSELFRALLLQTILDGSPIELVDDYTGEDAVPVDGTW